MMKKRILIIDDDASLRKLYAEELEDEGYEVVTANSGKKVIERIENIKPDAVVLDILMPEKDGVQTLKEIKKEMPGLPVVISTAYDYHEEAMVYSPDSFLIKNSDTSELKNIINTLIQKQY